MKLLDFLSALYCGVSHQSGWDIGPEGSEPEPQWLENTCSVSLGETALCPLQGVHFGPTKVEVTGPNHKKVGL